jgi:hypothetical protein
MTETQTHLSSHFTRPYHHITKYQIRHLLVESNCSGGRICLTQCFSQFAAFVSSSAVRNSKNSYSQTAWPSKVGTISCPETSVAIWYVTPQDIAEERGPNYIAADVWIHAVSLHILCLNLQSIFPMLKKPSKPYKPNIFLIEIGTSVVGRINVAHSRGRCYSLVYMAINFSVIQGKNHRKIL